MFSESKFSTRRLILRPWKEADFEFIHKINSDPIVMRYFPKLMTVEETQKMFERTTAHFSDHGFGCWMVIEKASMNPAGICGIFNTHFESFFTPAIEIGWKFDEPFWGKGYAYESALASLDFGFNEKKFNEIVSLTNHVNEKSWRLMARLGFDRNPKEDFDHPKVPAEWEHKNHRLYRLSRDKFLEIRPDLVKKNVYRS